jgi:lipopolysaccharide export system permease protein
VFRYIDDFVGKGVGFGIMAEFFFHAAMSLVPLSLPLSILIGSLMTFGNLSERLELMAMKAAGVSLFRIMRPLIVAISILAIASFYFSDHVLPNAQVRMWTLVFSIREKPLELEIPKGSFYNGITGRNIYVGDKVDDALLDIAIYDYSNGFENTSIILADTGFLSQSENKKKLILRLYSGETFENLKQSGDEKRAHKVIPYRRETFAHKEIVIDYDANFNELSPEFLEQQYVSKKTTELVYAVDSINKRLAIYDSTALKKAQTTTYFNRNQRTTAESIDTTNITTKLDTIINPKQQYFELSDYYKKMVINTALTRSRVVQSDITIRKNDVEWLKTEQRRHSIEWHKRHTLPFACLIFLFIGAPLGAIIRKGGMGMPLVMSVVLFIFYYIIDNTGYKLAREGVWQIWQGMWLSSFILLPLGITLGVLAVSIAVLRVALGVHFIKDVTVGILLGATIGAVQFFI